MRVVAIVQARMTSERLPGKVLEPLLGRPLLNWCVEAARATPTVDDVVVATSSDPSDDVTARACALMNVSVFRGSLHDVLQRYADTALAASADAVVRLTADCPLLDPMLITHCVSIMRSDPSLAMVTNSLNRTYPRGFDVEVISTRALLESTRLATGSHREHVTSWTLAQMPACKIVSVQSARNDADLRVTVDTVEDLQVVRSVAQALGQGPHSVGRVTEWLRLHPEIVEINAGVQQASEPSGSTSLRAPR